jgi:hypothetical protein
MNINENTNVDNPFKIETFDTLLEYLTHPRSSHMNDTWAEASFNLRYLFWFFSRRIFPKMNDQENPTLINSLSDWMFSKVMDLIAKEDEDREEYLFRGRFYPDPKRRPRKEHHTFRYSGIRNNCVSWRCVVCIALIETMCGGRSFVNEIIHSFLDKKALRKMENSTQHLKEPEKLFRLFFFHAVTRVRNLRRLENLINNKIMSILERDPPYTGFRIYDIIPDDQSIQRLIIMAKHDYRWLPFFEHQF